MIGKTISHYEILEKLGEGGMGVVYRAHDLRLDRVVALKFLSQQISATEQDKARFVQEAKAAAALNHPNICTIYGLDEVNGQQFIEMEFVEGLTLRQRIQSGPLSVADATAYAVQIAYALREAHGKGIVHRDIKADNVMITAGGLVKVMDFGLAKLKGAFGLTQTGGTAGTLAYMAPEQIMGSEVDERADIFSFGVVFFEMLTGRFPFRGDHEPAMMYSILNEEPQKLSTLRNDVPDRLVQVIDTCLQKNPESRYQRVDQVLEDVASPLHKPGQKPEPHFTVRGRPVRSRSIVWFAAAVILALALGYAAYVGLRLTGILSSVPTERQLVVLPFTTIGADSTKQSFCDGLTETLTSKLTQMEQFHGSFWIVPASEVRRSRTASPGEARSTFGANLAVTGNLQVFDGTYRLTLNLIDASNLRQLSSTVLDVDASRLNTLQEGSVARVMELLELQLNPETRRVLQEGQTAVPGAYELFLQGIGRLQHYADEEQLDAAISVLRQAVTEDSTYARAHAALAEAYWRKYEARKEPRWAQQAMETGQRAFEVNGDLPEVNVTLGMIHAGTGKLDEAVDDFRRALQRDATNAAAHAGLARAFEAKGMVEQAEQIYRQAILLKPKYWGGYNDLGVFYFRRSRYEDAISQFQEVIRLLPDNDRGFNNLGGIYYLLKRWTEARQMFERAFALKKTYRVCSNLGTLYYIEGNYAEAARMYEMALDLNDHDYRVWGNLAAAYYWTPEHRVKADSVFHRAIERAERQRALNPNDPAVISNLAGYYAMVGQRDKAFSLLRQEVLTDSKDAEVMYRVGTAYEQLKQRDQALRWIARAIHAGYSLSEIQHQPELRALLADERFQRLIRSEDSTQKPKN